MLQPHPKPSPLPVSSPQEHYRVVLVDDDPVHLLVWEAVLRRAGYEVISCVDGAAALRAVAQGCDCILSDYDMPGMNGIELLRAARRFGRPGFILLTGSHFDEVRDEAQRAGVHRVFCKPSQPERVLEAIQGLCRERRPSRT